MPQTIFQANLTAQNMFIDLSNGMPASILEGFGLSIQNQSLQTLYFALDLTNFSNWTMSNPANGHIGSVNAGSSTVFYPTMTRTNPTVDTLDSGSMRIYVYSDSGYSVQIDYADLSVNVYLENTESWSSATIMAMQAGNSQGFTGGTLTSAISVETGGYSYQSTIGGGGGSGSYTPTPFTRINTVVPNNGKARMTFYCVSCNTSGGTGYASISRLYITVNGTTIFNTDTVFFANSTSNANTVYSSPWNKISCDLSAYAGQTVTIVINIILTYNNTGVSLIMDRVVIAGEN